jgi:NAD(P)-dependent dehydrogenase (short-subunit alcohol dehydrogenase family)
VIFGASGGIGSALTARISKQEDASLILAAESDEALKQIGSTGENAEQHVADAQQFDQVPLWQHPLSAPLNPGLCYQLSVDTAQACQLGRSLWSIRRAASTAERRIAKHETAQRRNSCAACWVC